MASKDAKETPFQNIYRITDVFKDNSDAVKFTDFENFFNIYQDKDGYYRYNINSTIYLDIPSSRLKLYACQHPMHWPTISYNIYDTVRLAWVLMKVNNITPDIAFEIIPAGSIIKYPDRNDITTILDNFIK